MWLDFRKLGINQTELNEIMIKRAGVLLNDGLEFGRSGEGFLRMNIGTPRPLLEEGLKRIEKAVKTITEA
jgi:cystathionine beta-lyase